MTSRWFQLLACIVAALTCSTALAQLKITDFKVDYPAQGKIKITVSAEGSKDVKVGSYCVVLEAVLPRPADIQTLQLPGLEWYFQGFYCVFSTDFGKPDPLLKDNGELDEDPREGTFAITIDGRKWPVGKYFFTVGPSNRPAGGTYYDANQTASLTIGNPDLTPEPGNVKGAQDVVIYRNKDVYACFPSLTQASDGRLFTSFTTRVRASHIDPTGGSNQMVSSDGGQTWTHTTEQPIDPAWRTSDGTLVRAEAQGWLYAPISEKARLESEQRITMIANDDQIGYLGEAYYAISTDNGKTWINHPIDLPDDIAGVMNYLVDAQTAITKNGVRLSALYGRRKGSSTDEVFFLRSADEGKTWTFVEMAPNGVNAPNISETALVALPNGDVLAMSRKEPFADYLYSSISHDDGLTWSQPKRTELWGSPADMLALPDGRILLVYGYRRAPMGIRACISTDNGKTWDVEHELILRADGLATQIGDLGYPLLALRPDGRIFCIYYITTDGGYPYIAGTIFPMPEKQN